MVASTNLETPRLIVVGSGNGTDSEELWAPVLASFTERYEVAVIESTYPTWQGAYAPKHRIADITNTSMLFHAVADLRGEVADAAVITWNQSSVAPLAAVARKLRLRFMSEDAVTDALDMLEVRSATIEEGLPGVPGKLLHHEDDVVGAAETIGYPVVLRPRLRGGVAAVVAQSEGDLREALTLVAERSARGAVADLGVLVEQYVDGAELNVHSTVWNGQVVPVAAVRGLVGSDDPLRTVGYEPEPLTDAPWMVQIEEIVKAVHRRLGIDFGVTNTRLRLTDDGARLLSVDTWLTGELVRALGATGVELAHTAAAIAFEREPLLADGPA